MGKQMDVIHLQWTPHDEITLGQTENYHVNQIVTIST